MKILYLSCHEILEYDELKIFSELGHEVYSLGAYTHPGGEENRKRPPLPNLPYDPHFIELATRYSRDAMHPEMLEGIDMVIVMHIPDWIERNWPIFKAFIERGGRVVWRSIGQSISHVEGRLARFRSQGLEIVRYSPAERTIPGYIGEDAIIRFGKDPEQYQGWSGEVPQAINFTQSLKERGGFCGLETIQAVFHGDFRENIVIFGTNNENLTEFRNGGQTTWQEQIEIIQKSRVYFYTGTYPASYTLSFIEALMTGIPVVAVGSGRGNGSMFPTQKTYEVDSIIENGVNGFVADDIAELKAYIRELLKDHGLAKRISEAGRQTAIELFGEPEIKKQWQAFFMGGRNA